MQNKFKYNYITSDSKKSNSLLLELKSILKSNKKWVYDNKNYDYFFIFGGDGTLLRNIKNIKKNSKVILINGGNFGFLSFFDSSNISEILKSIINDSNYIRPLLIKTKYEKDIYYSLNEIVINSNHLINSEIYLDNHLYENFRGSGIIISTPLGSTGRTKSNRGSVIFPSLNVIQLIEIEPLSQKEYRTLDSPLILDYNTKININIKKMKDSFYLINDGNIIESKNNSSISIKCIRANFKMFYLDSINEFIIKLKKKYVSTE